MFNQHRILRVFKLITLLKTFLAKSIKRLAQSLEISERSCYRYLDLLEELGFEVEKDLDPEFYLRSETISEPFTMEESQLIHETLFGCYQKQSLSRFHLSQTPLLGVIPNPGQPSPGRSYSQARFPN